MKILSKDKNSWISIEENNGDFGVEGTYSIEAKTDIGHSYFRGINREVILLETESFKEEFDRFITDRSLSPKLEGTYETSLIFTAKGNNVTLKFRLGSSFCGNHIYNYNVAGEFDIAQEYLNNILEALPF